MHVIYAAGTCSDRVYKQLFSHTEKKPAFQSQKYHRLLVEGLAAHTRVDVVGSLPVNRQVMSRWHISVPAETSGNLYYHYIDAFRNPALKLAAVALGTFFRTAFIARKDSVVMVDCLNRTAALSAQLAAKLRGKRCVGIVTDLPDMLSDGGLARKMANLSIRLCTDYVFLTEAMNDYLGKPGKPYVVLEGHADITMRNHLPSLEKKLPQRVCLYAGSLSKRYGLGTLVEGFRMADIPGAELHIYGRGDYVEELKQIAGEDERIVYGGMLLSTEVVEKEMEAMLLVNPRPTAEDFVKYSFPSKTMEYMSTGTPVLTTCLPGIPKEYKEHLYFIEEESAQGIARALKSVFAHSDEELFAKGKAAREFVLEERNNVVQAEKILTMLEGR